LRVGWPRPGGLHDRRQGDLLSFGERQINHLQSIGRDLDNAIHSPDHFTDRYRIDMIALGQVNRVGSTF
jgi:hypothetical protein